MCAVVKNLLLIIIAVRRVVVSSSLTQSLKGIATAGTIDSIQHCTEQEYCTYTSVCKCVCTIRVFYIKCAVIPYSSQDRKKLSCESEWNHESFKFSVLI